MQGSSACVCVGATSVVVGAIVCACGCYRGCETRGRASDPSSTECWSDEDAISMFNAATCFLFVPSRRNDDVQAMCCIPAAVVAVTAGIMCCLYQGGRAMGACFSGSSSSDFATAATERTSLLDSSQSKENQSKENNVTLSNAESLPSP